MIKNYFKTINKDNIFLLIYLLCITLFYRLKDSNWSFTGVRVFIVIGCLVGAIQIIINYKSKIYTVNKALIVFMAFIVLATYLLFITRDTRLVIALIGIAACVGRIKTLTHFMTAVFFIQLAIVFGVLLTGGIAGFGHKNSLALNMMSLMYILLWIINWEKKSLKIKLSTIGMCFGFVFFTYFLTESESMLFFNSFGLVVILVLEVWNKKKQLISTICTYSYILLTLLTLFISLCYYDLANGSILKDIMQTMNNLFNGRLDLMCYSMKMFGVKLVGGELDFSAIDDSRWGYFHLDSGYMWIMQELGLLVLIIFVVAFTMMMKKYKDRSMRIFVLMVWAMWGFTEDIFYSVGLNFMLLYIADLLRETEEENYGM